jgi:hypothetical protein
MPRDVRGVGRVAAVSVHDVDLSCLPGFLLRRNGL